jgi:aminoglycoside phosphotransferase family enzyme/predicted kinase
MCRAELATNRRIAPALYSGVLAVMRRGGRMELADEGAAGDGEVLDWVVAMQRFPPGAEFDALAARGALDLSTVRSLAVRVARFHAAQLPVAGLGGAAGLAAVIAENRHEFAREADTLDPAVASAADRACMSAWAALGPLLDRRAREGHVRHCHGDLHLGNVCLFEGEPTPFDAIEFNPAIANIDTLFDLAFLVMDLEMRASRAHANAAFNAYLEIVPETDGLAALPLMLALRAGVRAHTRAAAARAQPGAGARAALVEDARRHLAAVAGFLERPAPRLIVVAGVSGTGKSTLARGLAPDLGAAPGAAILRSDVVRKELAGMAPTEALDPAHYTPQASARVYGTLMARAAAILAAGRSVVLDAVFRRPEEREAAAAVAAGAGCRFDGIWLDSSPRIPERSPAGMSSTPAARRRRCWRGRAPLCHLEGLAIGAMNRSPRRAGPRARRAGRSRCSSSPSWRRSAAPTATWRTSRWPRASRGVSRRMSTSSMPRQIPGKPCPIWARGPPRP